MTAAESPGPTRRPPPLRLAAGSRRSVEALRSGTALRASRIWSRAHVEPDRSMVGRLKVDYEYLATAIANALEPAISNAKK